MVISIRVERCWAGNSNYHYRLEGPDGRRFRVSCEEDQGFSEVQEEAERILEVEYGPNDFDFDVR